MPKARVRRAADLAFLDGDARWRPLAPDPGGRVWTDDRSNILDALMWRAAAADQAA